MGTDIEEFPIMMDMKEAVVEIRRNLKDKWKRKIDRQVEFRRCLQMWEKEIVSEKKTGIISLC